MCYNTLFVILYNLLQRVNKLKEEIKKDAYTHIHVNVREHTHEHVQVHLHTHTRKRMCKHTLSASVA